MKSIPYHKTLIYLITDSITNSVFVSQVVTPLIQRMHYGQFHRCVIISFERNLNVVPEDIRNMLRLHAIELVAFPIGPYIGPLSMLTTVHRLRTYLKTIQHYMIIARGPLAGMLGLQAYDKQHCNKIIIQARGLLAQEYAFTHQATTFVPATCMHKLRYHLFEQLELSVYQTRQLADVDISFEVVSDALGDYLVQQFKTDSNQLATPPFDLPPTISLDERAIWRTSKRAELGINHDAAVYTYCGSYKPWQCPDETITFFKKLSGDIEPILLIITNDTELFAQRLQDFAIEAHRYRIITKPHHEVMHYLAAADWGILLREHHILNWVSRPTKALEYEAAHLSIVHNNTVAYLQKKSPRNKSF